MTTRLNETGMRGPDLQSNIIYKAGVMRQKNDGQDYIACGRNYTFIHLASDQLDMDICIHSVLLPFYSDSSPQSSFHLEQISEWHYRFGRLLLASGKRANGLAFECPQNQSCCQLNCCSQQLREPPVTTTARVVLPNTMRTFPHACFMPASGYPRMRDAIQTSHIYSFPGGRKKQYRVRLCVAAEYGSTECGCGAVIVRKNEKGFDCFRRPLGVTQPSEGRPPLCPRPPPCLLPLRYLVIQRMLPSHRPEQDLHRARTSSIAAIAAFGISSVDFSKPFWISWRRIESGRKDWARNLSSRKSLCKRTVIRMQLRLLSVNARPCLMRG